MNSVQDAVGKDPPDHTGDLQRKLLGRGQPIYAAGNYPLYCIGELDMGQVTTKKEAISARRSGQLRYENIDVSDMVVRLYGDTAVVTARADVKGHQLGEDFSGPYRYTRVWVRRSGRWQAVSYQATVTQ